MTKDKGKGKETKPSLEIEDDAIKAKKAEAKDVHTFQLSKKEDPLSPAKTQSKCRSHQIFGATKFGFHLSTYIMCAQMWKRPKID